MTVFYLGEPWTVVEYYWMNVLLRASDGREEWVDEDADVDWNYDLTI
jgi:hypothetical protein